MSRYPSEYLYFVTDIELDGPDPDVNSMLSFATCVVRSDGGILAEFEAVLETPDDRQANVDTMEWWKTQPEAWAAARENPRPPTDVMLSFADWVESFPAPRIFTARPLMLDGMWMDVYLRRYAKTRVFDGPFAGRQIFHGSGLDLSSYIKGIFGHTTGPSTYMPVPPEWLGENEHSHRAIDDARGYATLLSKLFKIANTEAKHPQDFLDVKT